MKRYLIIFPLFSILFILSSFHSPVDNPKKCDQAEVVSVLSKFENVKVYSQASTSSQILKVLAKDDSLNFVRKANLNGGIWSIVCVNGMSGYVLTVEIYSVSKSL